VTEVYNSLLLSTDIGQVSAVCLTLLPFSTPLTTCLHRPERQFFSLRDVEVPYINARFTYLLYVRNDYYT